MGNSEQLEGENIIQKMQGGSSKEEQSAGIKRGGKIQNLTVVDIGKQYLNSFREICKELRRSWVRISVTILIEQQKHRLLYLYMYIYLFIYIYRVSQEECEILRESVSYVKLYRYNPKHLYPKLNGYGDNGQRSLKL